MITLKINGSDYYYPQVGDTNWGNEATRWASAITSGVLQKSGGLFQLLSELDFGDGYGLKSVYFKSRNPNSSTTGIVRLARTDTVSWRNATNTADLPLTVSIDNELLFKGEPVKYTEPKTILENLDIDTPVSNPTLTIPNDGAYKVNSKTLEIYLNGMLLLKTEDYLEIGLDDAISTQVQLLWDLVAGDRLTFRIR